MAGLSSGLSWNARETVDFATLASRAIFFLIEHAGRFKNLDEYYAFLDLPLSDKQLKREREITEFYINYKIIK